MRPPDQGQREGRAKVNAWGGARVAMEEQRESHVAEAVLQVWSPDQHHQLPEGTC